jgi:hypothetical protein
MPYPNCHENQRLKNKTYHTTHDILELSKSPVENHTLELSKIHKRCVPSSSWGEKPNKKFVQNLVLPKKFNKSSKWETAKMGCWVWWRIPSLSLFFFFVFFIRVPICKVDLEMGTRISDPHVCSSAASDDDDDDDEWENKPKIFLVTSNYLPPSSPCPTSHVAVFLPTHLQSTPHAPTKRVFVWPNTQSI